MPVTSAFSARNSRVRVNCSSVNYAGGVLTGNSGTYLYAHQWTVGVRVDDLDVATFEDYGFANHEDGLMDADLSFNGFWDARVDSVALNGSVNASDLSPPVLYPGIVLTNCFYYVKGSGDGTGVVNQLKVGGNDYGAAYYFPLSKVFGVNVEAGVRNTLNISYTARNQGVFYFPGQAPTNANPRSTWH